MFLTKKKCLHGNTIQYNTIQTINLSSYIRTYIYTVPIPMSCSEWFHILPPYCISRINFISCIAIMYMLVCLASSGRAAAPAAKLMARCLEIPKGLGKNKPKPGDVMFGWDNTYEHEQKPIIYICPYTVSRYRYTCTYAQAYAYAYTNTFIYIYTYT